MTAQQISFVKDSLQAAVSAGAAFNMNPMAILSQAAFESGWGTSDLSRKYHMVPVMRIGTAEKRP